MRILLCVLLAVLIFPAFCFASPDGEQIISADGGFRLASAYAAGPILIEVRANGNATIKLVSTSRSNRLWPDGVYGLAYFSLRDAEPRPFVTAGDKVDSVYVDVDTATEVIVTWTNVN